MKKASYYQTGLDRAGIWDANPYEGGKQIKDLQPITLQEFTMRFPLARYNLNRICEPYLHEFLLALEDGTFAFAFVSDEKLNPGR